jgi:4-alpha-glucanotransferase
VQDILGFGESARMNRPGRIKGNWLWRLCPGELTPQISKKIAKLSEISGR